MTVVHTGTVIHCRGCGREYKRPVVSVDVLNEERRERDDLRAIGDELQSAASRLAEYVESLTELRAVVPYEVGMAAIEARSTVDRWTELRTRATS